MDLSRRTLVRSAASVALAAPALRVLAGCASTDAAPTRARAASIALAPDPAGLLDLAPGLKYVVVSRTGMRMSDGLFEPGGHDGMATFAVEGDANRCLLVRNHELAASDANAAVSAFGADGAGARAIDPALIYDRTPAGRPHAGGTTTLLINTRTGQVERSHLSLAGTAVNCAGGPTPWGSWLSCEETEMAPGDMAGKSHGYVFDVPATARGLVEPVALTAMGRFRHEAAAVDPTTGVVYMTEDTGDSLFYRFLPAARGELHKGGRLQALALVEQASADTRNWTADKGGDPGQTYAMGRSYRTRWIDLDHVEAPDADLRLRGRAMGAAVFARGEGMAFAMEAGGPAIYFACTSGGAAMLGQVWRYTPSPHEGGSREADAPGQVQLFVESAGEEHFGNVDNIVASPRGELVIAEDGAGDQFVRAITPDGLIYPIARNADAGKSEFCGPCFSPDGRTLFVNIQRPGVTLAITGDWDGLRRAARRAV
jgi:secreted PhoX family phosphatase